MSLTGWVLRSVLGGAAAAALIAVVVSWPRLSGPGVRPIAARLGSLLTLNVLVLVLAAVQLNARYVFYADWTDLHGALTGSAAQASVLHAGAGQPAELHVPGPAAAPSEFLPALPPLQHGRILTFRVSGRLSGAQGTVVVELPPGYRDPAQAAVRYPVIEAFHGYPGTPHQMISTMNLGDAMAQQVRAGALRSALIVVPSLEVPPGVDSECVNGATGHAQLETWLAQDIPTWVARTFRVDGARHSWTTLGISAGGWCAAMIAMLHPAQFGAAIVMGGYFRADFSPSRPPYPRNSVLARRYDLIALMRRNPPPIAMWLETSKSDSVSSPSSLQLVSLTRKPMVVKAVVLKHAGHRIGIWIRVLPESLRWLGAEVSGFARLA